MKTITMNVIEEKTMTVSYDQLDAMHGDTHWSVFTIFMYDGYEWKISSRCGDQIFLLMVGEPGF